MARSYDVAVAALTISVPFKWVDNLLSRHRVTGVQQAAQGTTRRLSPGAILRLEIARLLIESLGLPVSRALALAEALGGDRGDTPVATVDIGAGAGTLTLDIQGIERRLALRLPDAVESAPRRLRGRPPLKRRQPHNDATG